MNEAGIRSLAMLLAFACAAPALAESPPVPQEEMSAEEQAAADWMRRLDEGAARLASARTRLGQLEDAKGRSAVRRYPRGDAKAKYLDDLEGARKELAEAEQSMPELIEEARRAGIEPGVLDRYESAAEDDGDDAEDEDEAEGEAGSDE